MTTAGADIGSVYHALRAPGLKAILFDLDDTLFDHEQSARAALDVVREQFACFARIHPADFERRHAGFLEELHLRVVAGEIDIDAARIERFRRLFEAAGEARAGSFAPDAARCYRAAYVDARRPIEGACDLLARLHERVRVAVVTNNLLEEQQQKLRHCGLDPHVDLLVVSEEAGTSKPDPAIFELTLSRLGCRADETLMIGDSWANDIAGARGAGIPSIWFNRAGAPSPNPAWRIPELRTLTPIDAAIEIILRSHPSDRAHRD